MEFQSETLADEELVTITGYQIPSKQTQWLIDTHPVRQHEGTQAAQESV
ncbi:DUF4224 domain-containing protein [Pseudomonas orientalis]